MTEEELQIKIAKNKERRERINARMILAKEQREKKAVKYKQGPDRSTFCQILLQKSTERAVNTSSTSEPHIKGTRRDGRCLDGSLDMTLNENKNKRKYID